jgi:serine/threonine protein kinase
MPETFGRYLLIERIGAGGMAEVFRAALQGPQGVEKLVALKRMLPIFSGERDFVTLFCDEARIAMQLGHANVAQVFDFGEISGSWYLAMEFVDGLDLGHLVERIRAADERMPSEVACFIVAEAARGLDYAHERTGTDGHPLGIVHRDVSPPNILLSRSGEVKIADFGIARATIKLHKTATGTIMGKFRYMSPEQVEGAPLDRRSDVFSLGVVLWELLAGEALFSGDSLARVSERVRTADVRPPGAGGLLDGIVLHALARKPDDRYARASDLARELAKCAPGFGREELAAYVQRFAPARPAPVDLPPTVAMRNVISPDPGATESDPTVLERSRPEKKKSPMMALIGSVVLVVAGAALVWRYLLASPAANVHLGNEHETDAAAVVSVDASTTLAKPPLAVKMPHAYDIHALNECDMALERTPHGPEVARRGVRADDFVLFATALNDALAGATADRPGPLSEDLSKRISDLRLEREVSAAIDCLGKAGALPTAFKSVLPTFLAQNQPFQTEGTPYDVSALAIATRGADPQRLTALVRANAAFGKWRDGGGLLNPVFRDRNAAIAELERLAPDDRLVKAWKRYQAALPKTDGIEVLGGERRGNDLVLKVRLGNVKPEALKPFTGNIAPGEQELHYPDAPDEPLVFAGPPEVRAWAGPLR